MNSTKSFRPSTVLMEDQFPVSFCSSNEEPKTTRASGPDSISTDQHESEQKERINSVTSQIISMKKEDTTNGSQEIEKPLPIFSILSPALDAMSYVSDSVKRCFLSFQLEVASNPPQEPLDKDWVLINEPGKLCQSFLDCLSHTYDHIPKKENLPKQFESLQNLAKEKGISSSLELLVHVEDIKKRLSENPNMSTLVAAPFSDRIVFILSVSQDLNFVTIYDSRAKGPVTISKEAFEKPWKENIWKNSPEKNNVLGFKALVFESTSENANTFSFPSTDKGWIHGFVSQLDWQNKNAPPQVPRSDFSPLEMEGVFSRTEWVSSSLEFKKAISEVNDGTTPFLLTQSKRFFHIDQDSKKRVSIFSPFYNSPCKLPFFFKKNSPLHMALFVSNESLLKSRACLLQKIALEEARIGTSAKQFITGWDLSGEYHRRSEERIRGAIEKIDSAEDIERHFKKERGTLPALLVPAFPSWKVVTGISSDKERVLILRPNKDWGFSLIEQKTDLFLNEMKSFGEGQKEEHRFLVRRLYFEK